ncbi:NUDIX hydrolase [Ottowia sp.]|jgi:ADP-ribose pyrophosphatase YjhB (NUDIX family)|uniref:NUDIX hydrolase n=1 Tax=Ottowia sp. TaxID=1898956 RepID=UPI002B718939|nr:NUDIX hydrolase [Ottowia sp.]HRN75503.1 NUDIX hydrolase [Ottowia sp.]HRQ02540.1 NUDIX hydrolase [Ottowia sp.]
MVPRSVKHCRNCGVAVEHRVPDDGDTRERAICPACGTIHYLNPLLVVGTVPYLDDKVLLCKRAIEPRWGKWTLPAGFMEMGETVSEGAARETDEEAGAQIEMGPFFSFMSIPSIGQVHVFFLARLLSERFDPGVETAEARLFTEAEVPWEELAFTAVRETLRRFFDDQRRGAYGVHDVDIRR